MRIFKRLGGILGHLETFKNREVPQEHSRQGRERVGERNGSREAEERNGSRDTRTIHTGESADSVKVPAKSIASLAQVRTILSRLVTHTT